ncbi:hypothetical protein ADUPG1_008892 [Aduncisulcus paluster]|uniref:Uncharacterized protein n=1 Tax=Aduncisulcus paluster TaxID=2918883 RepID=A0ABQ5KTM1_9EUKA|nr:hypothetical protein ADUPG1_008892 [Aduncisulcus paluster]
MNSPRTIQIINPVFIHKGTIICCPIARDSPNIKIPDFSSIKARNEMVEEGQYGYDQSLYAQDMMKGDGNSEYYTHISIPFSSSCPMKGAYIWIQSCDLASSFLTFTFMSSRGEKTSKKYIFPEFEGCFWYFLPIDLTDVVLCEITGKGRCQESFMIPSLVFFREETPKEITMRETRAKLWYEVPAVKAKFVKKGDRKYFGRDSIPIPCDAQKLIDPLFSMVKCKNESVSKESEMYDQSSRAQKILKREESIRFFSYLSIPFPTPRSIKGAFICVDKYASSPFLLFTFTDCDGKKTFKKYEFTESKHLCEWHFLPIDLLNVALCEIEGKGAWQDMNSLDFCIYSLVFTVAEESEIIDKLSLLPWK